MKQSPSKEPWYKGGLFFQCTGCGKCCTGEGFVSLSSGDIEMLANHLKISKSEFLKQYTRKSQELIELKDSPSGDCIFLENNQCRVYEARPVQCRTFPWWIYNLQSKAAWNAEQARCEGINHKDAPLIPEEEIAAQCATHLDNLIEQNFYVAPFSNS